MERSTIFNGKIHYKWSFSIATLNYQRVFEFVGSKEVLNVWAPTIPNRINRTILSVARGNPQPGADWQSHATRLGGWQEQMDKDVQKICLIWSRIYKKCRTLVIIILIVHKCTVVFMSVCCLTFVRSHNVVSQCGITYCSSFHQVWIIGFFGTWELWSKILQHDWIQ
jgi:hypothetical protein